MSNRLQHRNTIVKLRNDILLNLQQLTSFVIYNKKYNFDEDGKREENIQIRLNLIWQILNMKIFLV